MELSETPQAAKIINYLKAYDTFLTEESSRKKTYEEGRARVLNLCRPDYQRPPRRQKHSSVKII